jgi:predicted enzyme related to lactoylglutathione lyase
MTVVGTAVVWLPVRDIDQAVDFYVGTLGLEQRQKESKWAQLDANGLGIGLNANESPSGDGGAVIAFQTEGDLEDAVQRLQGQGVEFPGEISEHPWGRVASFKDPDGNDLQLYEPPKG